MNLFPLLVSAITTSLFIWFLKSHPMVGKLQDVPNERSLHVQPVPRVGGTGLLAGALAGWLAAGTLPAWWLLLPLFLLFVVSLLDDLFSLRVRVRMPAHLFAAALLIWGSGLYASQGVLTAVLVVLTVIWMTNLFNFMDGSNGLAGGMALFGFASYGVAAWQSAQPEFAMLNFAIVAAAFAFLLFNFNPARVFMGDAGSIPLGFLMAALGLVGWQQQIWPAWFPLLVFSPFMTDATVTLARRTLRGVKITAAHREHYYQRLIQSGWSHRQLALAEYGLMLAVAGSALWQRQHDCPWLLLSGWVAVFAGLMLAIDRKWQRHVRRLHAEA
jgi:UDP-GlcNAc:undecaprenyl-phosphate/decaprenyl-phosphate GlcNAc-1-phosphate transferase